MAINLEDKHLKPKLILNLFMVLTICRVGHIKWYGPFINVMMINSQTLHIQLNNFKNRLSFQQKMYSFQGKH